MKRGLGSQEIKKSRIAITKSDVKKEADLKIIGDWVDNEEKVLDLGCGRGILLEHLRETKNVNGLGVDFDCDKASACISRGVAVYQGDISKALSMLPDNSFDWVVIECRSFRNIHERTIRRNLIDLCIDLEIWG